LEDALIQQHQALENVTQRSAAMQHLLTDPDQLADYTNRFFTEVYPVDEAQPTQSQPYDLRYDQLPAVPASATSNAQAANPDLHWQNFGQVMNNNPEQAWRYLSQMGPETFRSKLLFLDNA
jgi:oxalate decarboxylase/phosphoglucose isomerase-like protein (cupin superfamily)